jgi:Kef-type K+ transport system membrane component KefB
MVILVGTPPLCRRIRLPAVVGLLLIGMIIGPHVFGLFGERRPIAEFLADLGKLMLMFFVGVEIDLVYLGKRRTDRFYSVCLRRAFRFCWER